MGHLYPVFLNLQHKTCLVIGGGAVAERKVRSLLECEARVIVVSPQVKPALRQLHDDGRIAWKDEQFAPEHLQGVVMVLITTDDHEFNRTVAELCNERGIWVNAADDPPNCDFYVPALLRRGHLAVAISTEGCSPMFAARLKRELALIITEDHGTFVDRMGELRELIKRSELSLEERKMLFGALVNGDLFDLVLAENGVEAEERIEHCISCLQD